ncbi:MAG: ROK family protein [Candidatus Latescibacteria bacterium]|nr:ROK family protein [Candidatus Latescibacterota bacterium]
MHKTLLVDKSICSRLLYSINMTRNYLLGIDLGGTQLRFILADEKNGNIFINKINMKKSFPSPFCSAELYKDKCFRVLPDSVKINAYIINKLLAYLENLNTRKEQISGIGISVAGKVFSDKSFIGANMPRKFTRKIGNKYAIDLISALNKIFKTRIEIENDANCAGIAQSIYYAHQGIDPNTTFYVTVSTGLGGGGPQKELDEIGHMLVDGYFPGLKPRCGCGAYGCIEAFASGEGIRKQTLTILDMYLHKPAVFKQFNIYEKIRTANKYDVQKIIGKSELVKLRQHQQAINTKTVFELAYQKNPDKFAYYLVDTTAGRFAKILVNISRIHNIERFGLGGSVITNNPQYINLVQNKINQYNADCILGQKIKVHPAPLGDYAADYGALFLVVEKKYQKRWIKNLIKKFL